MIRELVDKTRGNHPATIPTISSSTETNHHQTTGIDIAEWRFLDFSRDAFNYDAVSIEEPENAA
eukprot:CAMPEP_0201187476 /NCGR_PEP_ID=MMETSP0851-20130426/133484_1 /ASSEMBLY_ACC=CAM_ASM_000631 /TAXON_ID=183588 /ORGANISM="Pseudo-nitzschia fraudulenta, Strain WWA7" /LENGTH=63 /DNA_ID=CAMNT_0047472961 /DNA_START=3 /DNA_END=191 /DNA_ORIENTATION=+